MTASIEEVRTVNILVIGQSPRPALEAEFRARLGADVSVRTIGALDGLSREEISAHPPLSGADTLFTTLPDGSSTLLSKAHVTKGLSKRLEDLDPTDRAVNVLGCTGRFPDLETAGVISASAVLGSAVQASLAPGRKLGVFIPKPVQQSTAVDRWRAEGYDAEVIYLAPDSDAATIDTAAKAMADINPDLMIFDCISYTTPLRRRVLEICNIPSLLACSVVARLAAELIGG